MGFNAELFACAFNTVYYPWITKSVSLEALGHCNRTPHQNSRCRRCRCWCYILKLWHYILKIQIYTQLACCSSFYVASQHFVNFPLIGLWAALCPEVWKSAVHHRNMFQRECLISGHELHLPSTARYAGCKHTLLCALSVQWDVCSPVHTSAYQKV